MAKKNKHKHKKTPKKSQQKKVVRPDNAKKQEKSSTSGSKQLELETKKAAKRSSDSALSKQIDQSASEITGKIKQTVKDLGKSITPVKKLKPQDIKKLTTEEEVMSPSKQRIPMFKRYSRSIISRFGFIFKILKWLLILIGLSVLAAAGGVYYIWINFAQDLPNVKDLKNMTFAETTTIYDREGNILYKIYGEENRAFVPLEEINRNVIDATISIEDENFYHHLGFDPVAIVRAQIKNLEEEDIVQGASTITQQLAKNLYLTPEQTIERKIKELILSLQIEWYFSKDEILEMYFNKIPYGSNAFGIEAASKTFFDKHSSELTMAEAAILASLPKAPSYFSPYGNHKDELLGLCKVETCTSPYDSNYVWGRKDIVLEKMNKDGTISQAVFFNAWRDGFDVVFQDLKVEINAPHFVFYVRDYLEEKYGKEVVESGGLEVRTTLDPGLQKLAEETIAEYAGNGHLASFSANNAALVSVEPATGGVLAMVGSVNYWVPEIDGQVNVTISKRQPGSSFKPFIYGAAIEATGMGTGSYIGDYKTRFPGDYIPNNSDNTFKGRMKMKDALAQSRNIPAIKAFYAAGEEQVLSFLDRVGVTSLSEYKNNYNSNPDRKWDYSYGGAMAIGSGEVTLLEMAEGYATYANGGLHADINPILEIRKRNGDVVEQFTDQSEQVMNPQVAFIINTVLSNSAARPAGTWRNRLTIPNHNVAAKTGTSNKKVGNINLPNNTLTIGYTPSIATVVWAGNSDGTHMNWRAWGLTTAAPIWRSYMEKALEGKETQDFPRPEGIIEKWGEFYPKWWDSRYSYDARFLPLEKQDCTDEERARDPIGCKTKEEMEEEARERDEATLREILNVPDGIPVEVSPVTETGAEKPISTIKRELEESTVPPPREPEKPTATVEEENTTEEAPPAREPERPKASLDTAENGSELPPSN